MSNQLGPAFRKLFGRLLELALRDDEVRAGIRELGSALTALAAEPESTNVKATESVATPPSPTVVEPRKPAPMAEIAKTAGANGAALAPAKPIDHGPPATPQEIATLFKLAPETSTNGENRYEGLWHSGPTTDEDLPTLAARCLLKAEAVRWGLERKQLLAEGADLISDIVPRDRHLFDRAKTVDDCFLWMCQPEMGQTAAPAAYQNLAGCFEATAKLADLLAQFSQNADTPREWMEELLFIGAEVQSALRVAGIDFANYVDRDQGRLFSWIRNATTRNGVYIHRHMRKEDPADPKRWPDLIARMDQFDSRLKDLQKRDKTRREGFKKIAYHIKKARGHADGGDAAHWQSVVDATMELLQAGVPPSNVELRELILPVTDDLPDGLDTPELFQRVLREIDRFLALRPKETAANEPHILPNDVRQVREFLHGRAVVLIGGERRPWSAEALEKAFQLSELIWVEGKEHSSYTAFEADVARSDVALVILAIRWSSHGFGEVKNYCDKFGKPLVRLPAGYNPSAVAHHILKQVGKQFTGSAMAVAETA